MGKLLEQRNRALDDINAGRTVKKIRDLESRVRELEEENARLRRTNSSYASLTKAQESQLTNLRQRLYQLKGADSAIDSERQANHELTEQLAASQLRETQLREACSTAEKTIGIVWVSHHANRCDHALELCKKAIAAPISTEALDAYVAEKVKEAGKFDMWKTNPYTKVLETSIEQLTKQRDLAVEALEKWDMFFGGDAETAVLTIAEDPSTLTGCQKATKEAMSAIKESEAMAQVCEGGVR